ncbi:MAG: hypothetical protein PHE58_03765 [Candidatus Omnitrophica bacterium]|nr:hypothetical protein [Candidatus Omnitrophota bacterium]
MELEKKEDVNDRIKRRHYFIHPSSQIKYIAMSILPAFIMSIFCTFFVIKSGEFALQKEKEKLFIELSTFNMTIQNLEKTGYDHNTIDKVIKLKKEIFAIQDILKTTYFDTLREWQRIKLVVLIVLPVGLGIVGLLSLFYSHRIAGPMYRLNKSLDMLAEGKDVSYFRFRGYDEFKELAESFERLRRKLKDKGVIQ